MAAHPIDPFATWIMERESDSKPWIFRGMAPRSKGCSERSGESSIMNSKATAKPLAMRWHLVFRFRAYCPGGGCQSSTLFPSGSMTQPNFPYSESSVFSRTLQPSSRSD